MRCKPGLIHRNERVVKIKIYGTCFIIFIVLKIMNDYANLLKGNFMHVAFLNNVFLNIFYKALMVPWK